MTINEAMVVLKSLRGRHGELSSLRSEVSTVTRFFGTTDKTVEPKYDVKLVDEKCVKIENAIRRIDAAIKKSNAITEITVGDDIDELMSPIQ